MNERIELPEGSRRLLRELVRQREQAQALVDAALEATRAALGVPGDWVIRDVDEGFIEPPAQGPARAYGEG